MKINVFRIILANFCDFSFIFTAFLQKYYLCVFADINSSFRCLFVGNMWVSAYI